MATTDVFRTMIVPSAHVTLARQIAETVAPVAGLGMWQSQLSADGQEPATHYVSTGYIGPEWEVLMPLQTWEEIDGTWTQTEKDLIGIFGQRGNHLLHPSRTHELGRVGRQGPTGQHRQPLDAGL